MMCRNPKSLHLFLLIFYFYFGEEAVHLIIAGKTPRNIHARFDKLCRSIACQPPLGRDKGHAGSLLQSLRNSCSLMTSKNLSITAERRMSREKVMRLSDTSGS